MKNFIVFIVVVLVLGFGAYFAYRVYYRGESPKEIAQSFSEKTPSNVHFHKGQEAYRNKEHKTALKEFKYSLEGHDSGDQYNQLTEEQRERVLFSIGICYLRVWKEGGKKDASLQADGVRAMNRFLAEYPDSRHSRRIISKALADLKSQKREDVSETRPVD